MDWTHRRRERAFMLPVAGFVLLSPPLLVVFGGQTAILGVPLLYVYVFGIWGLLILGGWAVTRTLQGTEHHPQGPFEPGAHEEGDVAWPPPR